MTPARMRWLAWGLAALGPALTIGGYAVLAAAGGRLSFGVSDILFSAITIAFLIVGALVAVRHPRNPIGWIFLGVAGSTGLAQLAYGFVEYRLQSDGDPGVTAGVAAAYAEVSWVPFVLVPATFLLLLFPDGHLPSRRWRPPAWCAGAGIVGVLFTTATTAEPLSEFPAVRNPFAIDSPVMEPLAALAFLLLIVGVVAAVVSVVARYHAAGNTQRQQIKWLGVSGAVLAVAIALDVALEDVTGGAAYVGTTAAVVSLPAAVGIAILRHRLYDIDVVINRTLVYGALTATLAGTYIAGVLLLQLALSPLTASNGLAIAASTLAVAALFQPARRRIQAAVDRRFYRRKYDAARTLERFGASLRDEVEIDALADELRAIIAQTMQPGHVSLWLRETRP